MEIAIRHKTGFSVTVTSEKTGLTEVVDGFTIKSLSRNVAWYTVKAKYPNYWQNFGEIDTAPKTAGKCICRGSVPYGGIVTSFCPIHAYQTGYFHRLITRLAGFVEASLTDFDNTKPSESPELSKEEIVDCTYFESWENIKATMSDMDPPEIEQHLTNHQFKTHREITHEWNRWAAEEIFSHLEGDKLNEQTTPQ